MQWQNITAAYQSLFAAVIERAVNDLKGIGPECRRKEPDQAMAFILSENCEAWCLELKIDYERIKEKSIELYRQVIAKADKETVRKKRGRKPAIELRRVQLRQSPGKLNTATGR